jgi:hypothetical protein
MVLISGSGILLAPIVILTNLQQLRDLAEYETHCFFARPLHGWITKDLWVPDAVPFSAQIRHSLLGLLLELCDQKMLLIIDGRHTRLSLLAVLIFEIHGIDVPVLPVHSPHLLQAFDVNAGSSRKTRFREEVDKRMSYITAAPQGEKLRAIRNALVESFLHSLHRERHRPTLFLADPEALLHSDFTVEPVDPSSFGTVSTEIETNEMILTREKGETNEKGERTSATDEHGETCQGTLFAHPQRNLLPCTGRAKKS